MPPAPSGTGNPYMSGVTVGPSGVVDAGIIPMFVFQYAVLPQIDVLPIHDHRGNDPHSGGFAFAVYSPGSSLPSKQFSL